MIKKHMCFYNYNFILYILLIRVIFLYNKRKEIETQNVNLFDRNLP